MKKQRYVGFIGSLVFVALIFLEVGYKRFFSEIVLIFIGILLGYLAISFVFYALIGDWQKSFRQGFKIILVPIIVGLIFRFLLH
ncbi:MAG: hypothetical protein WDN09_02120 [bacterium]